MGATEQTPANLVIGAGDVTADDADFGVTADDNTYRVEQTIFTPDNLNGVPGALVGTHYKTREEAVLEVTVPEVNPTVIGLSWPGSESATVGEDTTIDSDGLVRRIPLTDYHDYALVVPGIGGKSFSFLADKGLNQAAIEYNGQNAGMMAPRLEIHSNWDPTGQPDTEWRSPHRIVINLPAS